jgi:hypothetical protein
MHQLLPILNYRDVIFAPLYFIVLLRIIIIWKRKYYSNNPIGKYIVPLFLLKIACCVFLACLYHFYYGYSDSQGYYTGGREIYNATFSNPKYGMELLFKPFKDCSTQAQQFAEYVDLDDGSTNTIAMYKLTGFVAIFCFGTYLPIAFVFTLAALIGAWRIFLVFNEQFPQYRKLIALSCLFAPSALLWGTNVIKDPLCLFGLGLCITGLYKFMKRTFKLINLIEVIIGAMLLLTLKDYIFYIFIAAAIPAIYLDYLLKIKNGFIKIVVHAIMCILIIAVCLWMKNNDNLVGEIVNKNFIEITESIQTGQMMTDDEKNSSYIIPNAADFSPLGIASSYLLSLNVALFRPYFWEIKNPLMVASAIESFAIMLFTAFLLFKTRFIGFFSFAFKDPLLLFALIFSLLMAPLAGFVSFNFGTLSRYKLPMISLFYVYLSILYASTKNKQSQKAMA